MPRPVFGAPAAPVLPHVSARPVETVEPSYDVAALGKATIDSRGGVPSGSVDAGETKLEIPPGLHESAVLSQLIENQTPFSGVVVAIGLNDYESVRERLSGGDAAAALNKMVLSMLRPQDFACRFLEDEYILVYPGERGSSAQRRLFQVSEKLWDFQLRSLGNLSVMFSWGGLEVTNETLSESVASARERMYQTKRNRKPSSTADAVLGRRKVVNG
ncbi:MAG: diguanylate cyclase [Bryobacterales bacterium]|nr:diguanylate cyclase [Bryobacterales bacterium]